MNLSRQMAQINRESSLIISVGTGEQPPCSYGGKNPFNYIGKKLRFTIHVAFHPQLGWCSDNVPSRKSRFFT